MNYNLRYRQFNAHSILIEWPSKIDQSILRDILNFKNRIELENIKQIVEVINSYNSLLIIYKSTIDNINDEFLELKSLYFNSVQQTSLETICWEIPVCYDERFAVDISQLSKMLGMSKSEIIERHSSSIYTVYFIGFLPGFLYLGGLDNSLHIPRKSTPNLTVKKGAVGIGGKQTGIYPQNSPGGWHIIGNSPVRFFDVKSAQPCFAKPGDKIKFIPIDADTYSEIQTQINNNNFRLNSYQIDD